MDKALQILNASAGSGKTFHLVKEYIKLLVSNNEDRSSFSSIIAMTFTNKAALEMKERIIKALDEISSPVFFKDQAKDLTDMIAGELNVTKEDIIERCGYVLESILHQYEDFHIMTIDKFNLRLIKSFARDLDLPNDFEVVLDESEIIEKIVDDLLNKLGDTQSSELEKLLLKYAQSNIDKDSSWNFRRSLVDFAKVLKSERDKKVVDQLMEMDFSVEVFGSLINTKKKFDASYQSAAEPIRNILESGKHDLDLLPGKTTTLNGINKIVYCDAFYNEKSLLTDNVRSKIEDDVPKGKVVPQELREAISVLSHYWEATVQEYATIELFLKNFFNMALLQFMANSLNEVKKNEQIIRISEFNTLISQLIQEENAPFIYERFGNKFHHFLLDEFQDTSHLQWLNLVPLIHDSLGYHRRNLIVGDPKQSIYRFKNGIAEQFIALPNIYNPDGIEKIQSDSHFFESMGEVNELDDNWRSSPQIVKFNNKFFKSLKEKMSDDTKEFYQSIEQNPKIKKNGRIKIASTAEQENDIVTKIIAWVKECKKAGFNYGDICILGEKNKQCNGWALGLNDAGFKVVSSDSLLIHSDLHVQLAISYFKWRFRPSGENEKKRFGELYFRIKSATYEEYKKYIVEKELSNNKTHRYFNDASFLDEHFKGYNNFFFKYENLYDLIQGFYQLMGYNELENPYLHHLADIIYGFGLMKGPDLKGFITDYESKKSKIAVQIPESDDAIKVMTIHKSKGLEFPVVMIPSIDFDLKVKGDFLVEIDEYVVSKNPSSKEIINPLKELYTKEQNQTLTDKINLCYVAMTRPVERLYIMNHFGKSGFGTLFDNVLRESFEGKEENNEFVIDINDGVRSEVIGDNDPDTLSIPSNIQDKLWFPDIALQDNEDLDTKDYLSKERQFGLQFHLMISKISSENEIDGTLNLAISEGEVQASNKDELKAKLTTILSNLDYQTLISGAESIINEQSILSADNKTKRPDKIICKTNETIIIDYKTGIPNEKDIKQVREYKSLLEEMKKYPEISCYLFYTGLNELRLVG